MPRIRMNYGKPEFDLKLVAVKCDSIQSWGLGHTHICRLLNLRAGWSWKQKKAVMGGRKFSVYHSGFLVLIEVASGPLIGS